jgi:hypothetical protein
MNLLIQGLIATLTTATKVVATILGVGVTATGAYVYQTKLGTPEAKEDRAETLLKSAERQKAAEAKAEKQADSRFWNGIAAMVFAHGGGAGEAMKAKLSGGKQPAPQA